MNICVFGGRLTRDPKLVTLEAGGIVCNFTIAINNYRKAKTGETVNRAAFADCEAWDTGAEFIHKSYKKGDYIIINASLRTDSWETNGVKKYKNVYRVNHFESLKPIAKEEANV